MSIKTSLIVSAVFFTVVSAGSGFLEARETPARKHKAGYGMNNAHSEGFPMCEGLDLTEKQQKGLKEYREKQYKEKEEIRKSIRRKNMELGEELQKDKADNKKINGIINDLAELEKKIIRNRADGILYMKNALTPEQRKKLEEVMPYGMGKLKEELSLTDEQYEKVRAILKERHGCEMEAMGQCGIMGKKGKSKDNAKWDEYKAKKVQIDTETDAMLSEVLSPEQMTKWAEMRQSRRKEYKKDYKGRDMKREKGITEKK